MVACAGQIRMHQMHKSQGLSSGLWWWCRPAELPSPESIAAAADDMTVRDSAGDSDSLLTCACAKRRLDWVELLSPQVKQCDLQLLLTTSERGPWEGAENILEIVVTHLVHLVLYF